MATEACFLCRIGMSQSCGFRVSGPDFWMFFLWEGNSFSISRILRPSSAQFRYNTRSNLSEPSPICCLPFSQRETVASSTPRAVARFLAFRPSSLRKNLISSGNSRAFRFWHISNPMILCNFSGAGMAAYSSPQDSQRYWVIPNKSTDKPHSVYS